MKVLLTGANGFLGSSAVKVLSDAGRSIRGVVLPGTDTSVIDGYPVEIIKGDLLEPGFAETAVSGCTHVIHTAATTCVSPARSKKIWSINYNAALSLALAAQKAGVKRYVHIGTANSFHSGDPNIPGDESGGYTGARYGLDYMDSKRAAQDELLKLHRESGFPVVIINPTFMFGPGDTVPGPGQMIIALAQGELPVIPPGGRSFAYSVDVAKAAVAALSLGQPGECYITGGNNLSYRTAFRRMAELLHCRAPRLAPPSMFVLAGGAFGSVSGIIMKKAPRINLALAKVSIDSHFYSSQKAIKDLGYRITDFDTIIKNAAGWFYDNGYLDRAG